MKQQQKTYVFWIVLFLLMATLIKVVETNKKPSKQISLTEFTNAVEAGRVEEVTIKEDGLQTVDYEGRFKSEYEGGKPFATVGKHTDLIQEKLNTNNVNVIWEKREQAGVLQKFFFNYGPIILLIVIFYLFMKQIQAGGGKAMSFGKSRARLLNANEKKVTFKDVAGVEEAKEELVEVVDFLKDPKKYTALGGKIPKGVLLVGPPGTGKTLLAQAVAGEAGVPFFSISGSDFVEMFVGVGASRVRDLFEQGKKQAPCIIFIDEIDAVGRHRGAGLGGGHDEREQTLNQLLVEMDGFESNEGVILIAATNRIDVLDPALLRPGRFDRRVTVGRPDVRGRHGILKVHTAKTPLKDDIDLEVIAKGTPGFTGADLANLVNEAALLAAREDKKLIETIDFENAKDKVLMGVAKKSMVISDEDKKVTAYHEAGHTLVGINLPKTDPIHKVSIIPRGGALGVTQTLPEEDMLNMSKERAENFIAFLMGGRLAEELIFNEITNGASNDIERATELARAMVCSWGMSNLGPITYGKTQDHPFAGMGEQGQEYSDSKAQEIDAEINRIVKENYEVGKKILVDNKETLIKLSEALIVWETLDRKQVEDIVAGKDIGLPIITKKDDDENKGEKSPSTIEEAKSEPARSGGPSTSGSGAVPA